MTERKSLSRERKSYKASEGRPVERSLTGAFVSRSLSVFHLRAECVPVIRLEKQEKEDLLLLSTLQLFTDQY